jgi:hypothetical protein
VSGTITAATAGSNYDTILTAHTGSCGTLTEVTCNDDVAVGDTSSSVEFAATGGTPYLIEVAGFGALGGGDLAFALAFSAGATPGTTPTATPTPTPTPTAGQATATASAAGATATPTTVPSATATPVGAATPDPAAAKSIEKCQKALLAGARTFAGKKLKGLDKCANGILKCIQTVADAVKRDACVAGARTKCTAAIDAIVGAEAKLRSAVAAKCGTIPPAFVAGGEGLGYGSLAADCGDVDGAEAVADCLVGRSSCELDRLFAAAEPRAGELIAFAAVPPDRRAALACLPDHGGTGADLDLESTTGKALAKCETAIKKASAKLVRGESAALAKCALRLFACAQTKRDDVACPGKATAGCAKDVQKVAAARLAVGPALEKKCGASLLDFDLVRQPAGANLDALASECTQAGMPQLADLDDYASCVVRQHDCRTATLLRVAMPRAVPLIEAAALNPPFAFPALCPAP